jgi:DNA-binding beta-propeller fold protein YncE
VRGGIETSGYAYDCTSTSDSNYLVVACGEMGISVFDISDFQNGQGNYPRVNWCNTPGYAQSVALSDDDKYAFVACGIEGFYIIDISDTADYHIVGSFDYNGYIKSLVYRDGLVYLAAELYGLQIVNVDDVTAPRLIGQIKTSYALDLDMDDKFIYVADQVDGIIVIAKPGVIVAN